MPTISISRQQLRAALEEQYSDEQFDEVCFAFGIELDDVVADEPNVVGGVTYKIDIPANRCAAALLEPSAHRTH